MEHIVVDRLYGTWYNSVVQGRLPECAECSRYDVLWSLLVAEPINNQPPYAFAVFRGHNNVPAASFLDHLTSQWHQRRSSDTFVSFHSAHDKIAGFALP